MSEALIRSDTTHGTRHARAGRWLVRIGYAVTLLAVAAAIVASVQAWGETSSVGLLGSVVALWIASGLIAYGRGLRGQLPPGAFRVNKGIVGLPVGLVIAYFGPAIEHFAAWWALLLPHATYGLLGPTLGLPHLLALALTIVVAPVEIIASVAVPEMLIVSPLSAILGRDNPVVASVRDIVGGIEVSQADGIPASGRDEATVWAGETALP